MCKREVTIEIAKSFSKQNREAPRYAMPAVCIPTAPLYDTVLCTFPLLSFQTIPVTEGDDAQPWSFSRISATTFLTRGSFAWFSATETAEPSCRISRPASQKSAPRLRSVPVATKAR